MLNEPRADTCHPLIQFRVKAFANEDNVKHGEVLGPAADVETRRKYHIGIVYPHVPIANGLIYEVEIAPGLSAPPPDIYKRAFDSSEYTDHVSYNIHIQKNCPLCNPPRKSEMVDERKAPGA